MITIRQSSHYVQVSKGEVRQVYYVRFKPVSEGHRFFQQEAYGLQWLDPKVWQYLLGFDAKIAVLLYDSGVTEDNSRLNCPGQD